MQTLIKQIRTCCTDITTAYIEIDEASSGGGTIHQTDYAGGMVYVETTIGKLILAMEQTKSNAIGKRTAIKTVAALLANIKRLPKAFADDPASDNLKHEHNQAVKLLHSALTRLQRLMPSLPDNGCVTLGIFCEDSSKVVQVDQ